MDPILLAPARAFAAKVKANFDTPVRAQPEDQLKAPVVEIIDTSSTKSVAEGFSTPSTVRARSSPAVNGPNNRRPLGPTGSGARGSTSSSSLAMTRREHRLAVSL